MEQRNHTLTYVVDAARVHVDGLPLTATLMTVKEITKMHGGLCQIAMKDGGMDTPESFGTYFYYEKQTQAQYTIKKLLSEQLFGGSIGLGANNTL